MGRLSETPVSMWVSNAERRRPSSIAAVGKTISIRQRRAEVQLSIASISVSLSAPLQLPPLPVVVHDTHLANKRKRATARELLQKTIQDAGMLACFHCVPVFSIRPRLGRHPALEEQWFPGISRRCGHCVLHTRHTCPVASGCGVCATSHDVHSKPTMCEAFR